MTLCDCIIFSQNVSQSKQSNTEADAELSQWRGMLWNVNWMPICARVTVTAQDKDSG